MVEIPYKRLDIKLTGYIYTPNFEPCKPRIEEQWSWKEMKTIKYTIHFDGHEFKIKRVSEVGIP